MQLFNPRLRLAPAGASAVPATASASAGGMIARTSGGGSQGGESGLSGRPGGGSGGGSNPPEVPRSSRSGQPQGQEQSTGYQPEERYWTDYLRIALPVVGLLLMLGLFWYWASSIIGDNGDSSKPPATVAALIISATAAVPTETPVPQIATTQTGVQPTVPAGSTQVGQAADGGAAPTPAPAGQDQTPAAGRVSKFKLDAIVVTNTDSVNLRDSPAKSGGVVDTLATGTELTVIGDASTDDGTYIWIQVRDTITGSEGYVADSFVDPA